MYQDLDQQLAQVLAQSPNYTGSLAQAAKTHLHNQPAYLVVAGADCQLTVPLIPQSASGAASRMATTLVRKLAEQDRRDTLSGMSGTPSLTSLASQPATQLATKQTMVWCRYSGSPLYQCDSVFPTEKVRVATHWIFEATWHKLEQLESKYKHKNHEQRNLLALAYLCHSDSLGSLIHLSHPIQLPELALKRRYQQLLYVSRFIQRLPVATREQVLSELPHFSTKALVVTPTKVHAGQFTSELLALGSNLLDWVDTCWETILNSRYLPADLLMDGCITAEELDRLGNLLASELTAAKKEAGLDEYWAYILDEVQEAFSLPSGEAAEFAKQLAHPTDESLLEQLLTYLRGLRDVYQYRGSIYQIPAQQFQKAISTVATLLAELQFNQLDLDGTKQAPVKVVVPTLKFQIQVTTSQPEAAKPSEATSKLAGLQARLASIKQATADREVAKQQAATDRVTALRERLASLAAKTTNLTDSINQTTEETSND